MQRVHSIDFLRGLLALSILFYHLTSWIIGVPDANTLLGKLGIYGVSAFFVISGISMYLSYSKKEWNIKDIKNFATRRFARIAPVYFIAATLVVIISLLSIEGYSINIKKYLLNISLIFGFVKYKDYMVVGGWSIGVEMVFYALFPLIMSLIRRKSVEIALYVASFILIVLFGFYLIRMESGLAKVWYTYINPFNQLFFFISGMMIAKYLPKTLSSRQVRINISVLALSLLMFLFYPSSGEIYNLFIGTDRILMSVLTVLICAGVYNLTLTNTTTVGKSLNILGDISYPVYLLHGVLFAAVKAFIFPLFDTSNAAYTMLLTSLIFIPFVLLASFLVYQYIEKPAMQLARGAGTRGKHQKAALSR